MEVGVYSGEKEGCKISGRATPEESKIEEKLEGVGLCLTLRLRREDTEIANLKLGKRLIIENALKL